MKLARLLPKHERGQSVVEFALALPILVLTVIGTLDFGLGVYYYNTISHLAREGARSAVVLENSGDWATLGNAPGVYNSIGTYSGTNTVLGKIVAQAGLLDLNSVTVTISAPNGTARNLNLPVSVRIDYPFCPLLANWVGVIPTINLSAETTMRIE